MKDFAYGIVPIWKSEGEPLFLLIHQQKGHWAFPKGHQEPGETDLETAQREFEEETGIRAYEVQAEPTFSEKYFFRQNKEVIQKTVIYYLAWVHDQKVSHQEAEVQATRWLPYREAKALITFAGGKKVLREVRQYLQSQQLAGE